MKTLVLLVVCASLVVMSGCAPSPSPSLSKAVITSVTEAGPCWTSTCTQYYRTDLAGQVWYTGVKGAQGLNLKPGITVHLEGGRIFAWEQPIH